MACVQGHALQRVEVPDFDLILRPGGDEPPAVRGEVAGRSVEAQYLAPDVPVGEVVQDKTVAVVMIISGGVAVGRDPGYPWCWTRTGHVLPAAGRRVPEGQLPVPRQEVPAVRGRHQVREFIRDGLIAQGSRGDVPELRPPVVRVATLQR